MVSKKRDKKCVYCGEVMTWDDWADQVLNPTDWGWKKKRYCSANCSKDFNSRKLRERREQQYNL